MVIGNPDGANSLAHPSGIPQDKIDNIMSGISNTGDVKMNNHRKKLRQRFDIIKKLGQGTYGKVQLGINKESGQEVAIKTIKKCKIEAEADLIRIRREVQIMSSVQHPNIIHIYEVFENREKMVLVMEFAAGGELYDYLSERKVLSEEEARRIFRQVSTAVYYCHKHKICHRDLKLENILLDEHGNAKIADFGLSNVFDEQRLLATFCGSPLYASPEIVEGTPYLGPEVDCWSLGVLLYTLVYGSMPFDGSNFKRLVKQISQGDYYEPKKPSRASSLIRDMLTVCPRKRATIEQICSHWWVNENDNLSCLELAESLANQTPVRLDVLLSLSPTAVTAEQLVVPSNDVAAKTNERVARSHSVGSIREMGNTEAERRILDMVAAGGEAALMPSPTRTITPAHSPVQTKRKLENTVSTENAAGAVKKKEKPVEGIVDEPITPPKSEEPMDVSESLLEPEDVLPADQAPAPFTKEDMQVVAELSEKLLQETGPETKPSSVGVREQTLPGQKTVPKLDSVEESPEETNATKVIKKFVNKHKTADLVAAINKISPEKPLSYTTEQSSSKPPTLLSRKSSLPDESLSKFNTERRKSRILETAEKFQQMSNASTEKPKKFVIPGVSVGNFKKEFERKASVTTIPTSAERRALERRAESIEQSAAQEKTESVASSSPATVPSTPPAEKYSPTSSTPLSQANSIEGSDSKNSLTNFSLEEARRSMENSIALLKQAQNESSAATTKDVEQLCAKTKNCAVSDDPVVRTGEAESERERKLKNARAIIGNAILPGIRRPLPPFSMNGRSISGSAVLPPQPPQNTNAAAARHSMFRFGGSVRPGSVDVPILSSSNKFNALKTSPAADSPAAPPGNIKTSRAEITLKSATLPRRKTGKTETQLDIKPKIVENSPMRFTTEMQHPVQDLRSAPIREMSSAYSPVTTSIHPRAASLEPREHIIPIQRPPQVYTRTSSNTTTRSGSLSRQSTIDSESDTTTTNMSQSTIAGSSQPIKKSPREFIIPIAVEGGGFITPREGSIEPSESSQTASSRSTFTRLRPRRIGSILPEADVDENLPFQKIRTTSMSRGESDDDPRFTLHRLRSSRPVKKISQENDSNSSGEEDDDDGFEILTAENLFSTLLQRVRALTNRLNVNNDITSGFPNSSRLLSNMRQNQSPFWNQEPFGRSQLRYSYTSETVEKKQVRLSSAASKNGAPWRHSMSRDLGTDMESMFTRTGATLPRGNRKQRNTQHTVPDGGGATAVPTVECGTAKTPDEPPIDLADLDLSRLRLSKKDLETLSSITPGLPKCFQEQLLAKLPPTQARKLSRTLSMQNNSQAPQVRVFKRSQSGGRGLDQDFNEFDVADPIDKTDKTSAKALSSKANEENYERCNNPVYRRCVSRTRYDFESAAPPPIDVKSRSSSVCRTFDDYSKSLCSSYSSDISDKYKYYSPYLAKPGAVQAKDSDSSSMSPQKRYDSVSSRESCLSPTGGGSSTPPVMAGRPPSGCLSPPVPSSDGSLRRRSQRRISRFLRPDFFDENTDESVFVREKKHRERETQSVLREIREKSRESSRDRLSSDCDNILLQRKNSLPDQAPESDVSSKTNARHVRNKSMETFSTDKFRETDSDMRHRRSLSRSRELSDDKGDLANKILKELRILSAVKSKQDQEIKELSAEKFVKASVPGLGKNCEVVPQEKQELPIPSKEKTTVKKVKKVKPKDKSITESPDLPVAGAGVSGAPAKITTVVKKVKKIVKKSDTKLNLQQPEAVYANELDQSKMWNTEVEKPKRESRLKRPKSYPSKEPEKIVTTKSPDSSVAPSKLPISSAKPSHCETGAEASSSLSIVMEHKENRLVRPKSYPVSKMTPPKEIRKTTRTAGVVSIPISTEGAGKSANVSRNTSEEKSYTTTPTGKSSDTSTSSDTKPAATIKKIAKVPKNTKLSTNAKLSKNNDSKDSSPTGIPQLKDKSPEKKVSKGLLYAIGQKFEKLRDSAMSKEKKPSMKNDDGGAGSTKKSLSENASPEKGKLVKKKLTKSFAATDKVEKFNNIASPTTPGVECGEKRAKSEKKSRIDAMIRSLRERSVPRGQNITESGYIKRAVSVEEMPGTFNKCTVNRVLGLFKRFEKDDHANKVRNTRSTSNIERQIHGSRSPIYQREKDKTRSKPEANMLIVSKPEFSQQAVAANQKQQEQNIKKIPCPDCIHDKSQAITPSAAKRYSEPLAKTAGGGGGAGLDLEPAGKEPPSSKEPPPMQCQSVKDKRKALMLDLVKLEKLDNNTTCSRFKPNSAVVGNGIYSNVPCGGSHLHSSDTSNNNNNTSCTSNYNHNQIDSTSNNNNNNNNSNNCCTLSHSHVHHHVQQAHTSNSQSQPQSFRVSSYEINRNHVFSPSSENLANYSSDSRSCQDDCASTSTFLSPTDEPELYFDNWSVCSEDNYTMATPSPTVSRLSRASQFSSPSRDTSDRDESVIDRIKRRSFYSRFNEKKPKRTSSIVGPTARDYYRENNSAATVSKSRSKLQAGGASERASSPDITQEFFRPLKLSPVGSELKPPAYKSTLDYSTKPRKSLNDIFPSTSPSFLAKRYTSSATDSDYLLSTSVPRSKLTSSSYDTNTKSSGSLYYNTYNPKRRSSYNPNGSIPTSNVSSSNIDGYATVGRRTLRPYDQRTVSLFDSTGHNVSSLGPSSSFRREHRTPARDYSSISRSNSHYRTSSSTRSPTNI